MPRHWTVSACVTLAALAACAAPDDWPQWLGPQRDGLWRETGIIESFPEGGPALRWRAEIGGGYAGPSVAEGRVFVPDFIRDTSRPDEAIEHEAYNENWTRVKGAGTERLLCLDEANGQHLWAHEEPVVYTHAKLYANGPRVTPHVDGDRVYWLGAEGLLTCLRAATGEVVWQHNLVEEYGAKTPSWGFAAHPVIDGDKLIAMVGGEGTAVMAFDKHTGQELWRALSCTNPGYAQLVVYEVGGARQLLAWHGEALNSLDPETGELHWSEPVKPTAEMTIGMPRLDGNSLYIMSWSCSRAFELDTDEPRATLLWEAKGNLGIGGQMNVPWVEDGCIYAADLRGVYRCARLDTGERLWETEEAFAGDGKHWIGNIFTVKNGERVFLATERGDLVITKLSPAGYEEIDRAKIIDGTNVTGGPPVWWSHPAFANRSIYVRNDREILCYSLAAGE